MVDREKSRQKARHLPPVDIPLGDRRAIALPRILAKFLRFFSILNTCLSWLLGETTKSRYNIQYVGILRFCEMNLDFDFEEELERSGREHKR